METFNVSPETFNIKGKKSKDSSPETTKNAIDIKILTQYEKQKVAIYKWRNKNIDAYHLKMHQYNKKNYENNREEKLQKVKAYQLKKREESGQVLRCVGRPSIYSNLKAVLDK